jgi:cytidylate kinase
MGSSGSAVAVLAIDGLSGSGKSTVARQVAQQLGWAYLDTGALYRAVTLAVLRQKVDPSDTDAVVAVADRVRVEVGTDPRDPRISLDGADVADAVRGDEVTAAVSQVSAVPGVRSVLLQWQRAAAAQAMAGEAGIVVEGRDIGTVVFPEAPVKVFMVADPRVRARRRVRQDRQRTGEGRPEGQVLGDLERRDSADSSRTASPLRAAADAVTIDSTALDVDEVVGRILRLAATAYPPERLESGAHRPLPAQGSA